MFDDPSIDEITAEDLLGDYPAVQYVAPSGTFHLDLLTRLGEAFAYQDLEIVRLPFDDLVVSVVSPRTALPARGESSDGIRQVLHPPRLRCSFFKYDPIFSVVAPCLQGRITALGARRYFHHGPLPDEAGHGAAQEPRGPALLKEGTIWTGRGGVMPVRKFDRRRR